MCPGGGTLNSVTLGNICSKRGVCDDLLYGSGKCTCNQYFSGTDCSSGLCPGGKEYVANSQSQLMECSSCVAGKYKNGSGNSLCLDCPLHSSSNAGASSCYCQEGYFLDSNGLCIRCSKGRQKVGRACVDCPAGKFKDLEGQSSCRDCAKDTFSTHLGAASSALCKPCPAFTTTGTSTGQQDCECDINYFADPNRNVFPNLTCIRCPQGSSCGGVNDTIGKTVEELPALEGFWRVSAREKIFYPCLEEHWILVDPENESSPTYHSRCPGGKFKNESNNLCTEGSGKASPLCAICNSGFRDEKGICIPCPEETASAKILVNLGAFCCCFLFWVRQVKNFVQPETDNGQSQDEDAGKDSGMHVDVSHARRASEAGQKLLSKSEDIQEAMQTTQNKIAKNLENIDAVASDLGISGGVTGAVANEFAAAKNATVDAVTAEIEAAKAELAAMAKNGVKDALVDEALQNSIEVLKAKKAEAEAEVMAMRDELMAEFTDPGAMGEVGKNEVDISAAEDFINEKISRFITKYKKSRR